MLTIRNEQARALGDMAPNEPVILCCEKSPHWIEFQLVDRQGEPVPGEPYRVRLPDQSLHTGATDAQGRARFESILAGNATIVFTGFDEREWQPG